MKKKILVVDSIFTDRRLTTMIFEDLYDVLEAENKDEAMTHLYRWEQEIVLIFLDMAIPEMNRFALLRKIRQDVRFGSIPIIVTSRNICESDSVSAFRYGASDCLKKPFPAAFVKYKVATLLHSLDALYAKCESRDFLTGMYNRDAFFTKSELRIRTSSKLPHWIVCCKVMNLDKLKKRCSQERIDGLLRFIATTLYETVCSGHGDCGRIEQEVFALCISKDIEQIRLQLRLVLQKVLAYPFHTDINIRFCATKDTLVTVEDMCENAIEAIDSDSSDDICVVYDEYMRKCQEKELATMLRIGLDSDQFSLNFSPFYHVDDSQMTAVLAEFVWTNMQGEKISYSQYREVAETYGLAAAIDNIFYDKLFSFVKDNPNGTTPTVYVPLSTASLKNVAFPNFLTDLLVKYCLSTNQFVLIVSPKDFLKFFTIAKSGVDRLRDVGFRIALGGFGDADYQRELFMSSQFHSIILSFDLLRNVTSFENRAIYLNTAICLSKIKQLPLLATNVISHEECSFGKSIGCSILTGDIYTSALSADEFVETLKRVSNRQSVFDLSGQSRIPQQYLWDTQSPFNNWFDSIGTSVLVVEKVGSILSLLRANNQFFNSFDVSRYAFSTCDKPFLSFVLPEFRHKLISACNESMQFHRQTQTTVLLRCLDTTKKNIYNVSVRINCVFYSKFSTTFLFTLTKQPACNNCEMLFRQRLLLDAVCDTDTRGILLFTFNEKPCCIYVNQSVCGFLGLSGEPIEYVDHEFHTLFRRYFNFTALDNGLDKIRNGSKSVTVKTDDKKNGVRYSMEMHTITLSSGEKLLRCEIWAEETVSEYTLLSLCQ